MKNKKAELESMIKIILWIVFLGIALIALYYLFKTLGIGQWIKNIKISITYKNNRYVMKSLSMEEQN